MTSSKLAVRLADESCMLAECKQLKPGSTVVLWAHAFSSRAHQLLFFWHGTFARTGTPCSSLVRTVLSLPSDPLRPIPDYPDVVMETVSSPR